MYKYNRFIVLEGNDGSGKTTQANLLVDYLNKHGEKAIYIKFPNYQSVTGGLIRKMLDGEYGVNADNINLYSTSILYALDRFNAVNIDYKKYFYEEGYTIVCDRYMQSNLIHQGAKLYREDIDISNKKLHDFGEWLFDLEYDKMKLPKPDDIVFLSLPISASLSLLETRYKNDESKKDIHEQKEFMERSLNSATYFANACGWSIVNCYDYRQSQVADIYDIHAKIKEVLQIK